MRLHFIRHGETDWNASRRVQGQMESHLSEQGRQQATKLAIRLRNYPIEQVYCSSSVRTRETAQILFSSSQPETAYQDDLREIHLGPWEGNLYDDLQRQDPQQFHYFWHEPHRFSLAGAETFLQLQQRGVAAVRKILEVSPVNEIAIVSHGAIIKSILCHFEKRPLAQLWQPPKMHNCAHSIMEFDNQGNGLIIQYAGHKYRSGYSTENSQGTSD